MDTFEKLGAMVSYTYPPLDDLLSVITVATKEVFSEGIHHSH